MNKLKSKLGILDMQVEIVALKRRAATVSGNVTIVNKITGVEETKGIDEWFSDLSGYYSTAIDVYQTLKKAKDGFNQIMDWIEGPSLFSDDLDMLPDPNPKQKLATRVSDTATRVADTIQTVTDTVGDLSDVTLDLRNFGEQVQVVNRVAIAANSLAGTANGAAIAAGATAGSALALATKADATATGTAALVGFLEGIETIEDFFKFIGSMLSGGSPGDGQTYDPINMNDYVKKSSLAQTHYTKAQIDQMLLNIQTGGGVDLSNYYTKTEANNAINLGFDANIEQYYTKMQIDSMMPELDNYFTKQQTVDTFVSGFTSNIQAYPDVTTAQNMINTTVSTRLLDYYNKAAIAQALLVYMNESDTMIRTQSQIDLALLNYYTKAQSDGWYYTKTETQLYVENEFSSRADGANILALNERLFSFDARRVVTINVGDIGNSSGQTINTTNCSYYCQLNDFIVSVRRQSPNMSQTSRTMVTLQWNSPGYLLVPFFQMRNSASPTLNEQNDFDAIILSSTMQENAAAITIEERTGQVANIILYVMFFRVGTH